MQRATFLRTRTKKRIRILPRVPTLQTYSFWPIGVFQLRLRATFTSQIHISFKYQFWCPFTARPARRGRLAPARRQGRHPSPRPPPGSPRRLRVRRGRRCVTTAGAHAPSRGASAASTPPRLRGLATAPRLAPATPRRRAPPLGASSRVPPVGLGRAGGGRCKGCTCEHAPSFLGIFLVMVWREKARMCCQQGMCRMARPWRGCSASPPRCARAS